MNKLKKADTKPIKVALKKEKNSTGVPLV